MIPIAFSEDHCVSSCPTSTPFHYRPLRMQNFPAFSAESHFALAGDWNGDGYDDLTILGGNTWQTVPALFMRP